MDVNIKNLSKIFGSQRAVDNISFKVNTGEIIGFLGPNGAGKSTTMKMITGYLNIENGNITVGGKSVKENSNEIKKNIGYLPEHNPLYTEMSIIDYLNFCASLQGMEKSIIQERIKEMIKTCGLNREKHKLIRELSKGYRQRVGIAQAMIHDPDILILDEPTTGLDPNQIIEIRKLIRDLGKEKTVILSTHILPEVEATCDRILIINKGKIVADGSADTLRKQAKGQEIIKACIEDGEPSKILLALNELTTVLKADFSGRDKTIYEIHSQPNQSSKREIFNLCVKNKWVLTQLTTSETKLEDIFRNLTLN